MPTLAGLCALIGFSAFASGASRARKPEDCLVDDFYTPCSNITNEVINGIELNVFRIDDVNFSLPHLDYVAAAAKLVMPTYSTFLKDMPLSVDVHVVNEVARPTAVAFASLPAPGYCVIQIQVESNHNFLYQLMSENNFTATVAHELYHCVQRTTQPATASTEKTLRQWWSEGTAEYFGCHFFPPKTLEWRPECAMARYDASLPLYEAPGGGYPAALLFQYLENTGWSVTQIHNWMLQRTTVTNAEELKTSMSQDDLLTASFPHFATSFADRRIKFSNGQAVLLRSLVKNREYNFPYANGTSDEMSISTHRWTIQELFHTTFSKDKRVSFSFVVDEPDDDGTILQYRVNSRSEWRTVKSGTMVVVQYPDISNCLDDTTTYDFLVTSTSDPARDVVHQDQLAYSKITFYVSNMSEG